MDIVYILKVLWRKKWWLIGIPVVSTVAAYFFTLSMVDLYRSTTQIATGFTVADQTIQVGDGRLDPRGIETNFSNVLESMNSGLCTNLVSYRLVLHDLDSPAIAFRGIPKNEQQQNILSPDEIEIARKTFRKKLENMSLLTTEDENAPILFKTLNAFGYGFPFIKGALKTFRIPNTDFIHVEFTSSNPRLSAYTVNAFCEEFLRYYREQRMEGAGISVKFFKELVDQRQKDLAEKTEALKNFKTTGGVTNLGEESTSNREQIANLENQRGEIEAKIYGFDLSISRFEDELAAKNAGTTTTKNPGNNASKIVALKNRINKLNERYVTTGSNNQALKDSLEVLRQQQAELLSLESTSGTKVTPSGMTAAELRSKISDLKIEREIEKSKLSSVTSKIRNLGGRISGQASKEAILNSLQTDVDVAQKDYLEANKKYTDASTQLRATVGTIRQAYTAPVPVGAVGNKRMLIVAAAGVTTLLFCVFVIIGLELLDTTIKTPEQFKRAVKLDLAEQLIKVDTQTLNFKTLFEIKSNNVKLETFKEYVRKLRFQIDNIPAKTFLITSPKKGEGKTFIIFTLAYVMSLVNKRVLIIDTNFKNNALTKWLSVKKTDVKLLERKRDYDVKLITGADGKSAPPPPEDDGDFLELVSQTNFKNIYLIGNNGGFESPDEILSGRDFGSLIAQLSSEFDYILLEGASLNEYSDSKELIKYVEKVIPVFSAETSIGQLDKASIVFLRSLGSKLGGAILNKVELKDIKM